MKPAIKLLNALPLAILLLTLVLTPAAANQCGYDPRVAQLLAQGDSARWMNWIAELSGEKAVVTADGAGKIATRSSLVLFEPGQEPNAFTYLQEQLIAMGFRKNRDFEIHTYDFPYAERHRERNWKNLILTFPGNDPILKEERVLLMAHLDSISPVETTLAPGADDNATGAAGLLEAALSLRHHQFARTIHLIWFSGEEQSRQGSKHFVADYADWLLDIKAVINLDMFGFDWDQDRCFEVHAGVLPGSQEIGTCLASVIDAYRLNLKFDFLDDASAYALSDHQPFWQQGVPAVMVIENFAFQPNLTCGKGDRNYHYHQITDTITYINEQTGFAILQAAIGALATMAEPLGVCFEEGLRVHSSSDGRYAILTWQSAGAQTYQIWKCDGEGKTLIGETSQSYWVMPIESHKRVRIDIVARTADGCQSLPESPLSTHDLGY